MSAPNSSNVTSTSSSTGITAGEGGEVMAEELQCSECHMIPLRKAPFQCRNAHLICQGCFKTTVECKTCGWVLETDEAGDRMAKKIMCHAAVGALMDHMTLVCSYRDQGCEAPKMGRRQLSEHVMVCEVRAAARKAEKLRKEAEARNSLQNIGPLVIRVDPGVNAGGATYVVVVENGPGGPVAGQGQEESQGIATTSHGSDGGESMEVAEVSGSQGIAEEEEEGETGAADSASQEEEEEDISEVVGEGLGTDSVIEESTASQQPEGVSPTRPFSDRFSGGLGDRVFPVCIFCQKFFNTLGCLQSHYDRCHSKEQKTAFCNICDENQWDMPLAARHIANNHHQPIKDRKEEPGCYCGICRENMRKMLLQQHIMDKHSEELK